MNQTKLPSSSGLATTGNAYFAGYHIANTGASAATVTITDATSATLYATVEIPASDTRYFFALSQDRIDPANTSGAFYVSVSGTVSGVLYTVAT